MEKFSIVTPCLRVENLELVKGSIDFQKVHAWYIVYDCRKVPFKKHFEGDPKIIELECTDEGCAGHPNRNVALEIIKDGLVYFLDDDNIIHPDFWNTEFKLGKVYTFNQLRNKRNGEVLSGRNPRPGSIDTAQCVFDASLLKGRRFKADAYDADGILIRELCTGSDWEFIDRVLCYYNYLVKLKVEIHVAFHVKSNERLSILKEALSYFDDWEDDFDLNIIIHSNEKCPDSFEKKVEWIDYETLSHPYELTWKCMEYIDKGPRPLRADYYIYMEDDTGIPKNTFEYWLRYPHPSLGIIRKTLSGHCNDILDPDSFISDVSGNFVYKMGPIYKACWFNTKFQMEEYIKEFKSTVIREIHSNINWSRERAAFGNTFRYRSVIPKNETDNCTVIHLDENKIMGPLVSEFFR